MCLLVKRVKGSGRIQRRERVIQINDKKHREREREKDTERLRPRE